MLKNFISTARTLQETLLRSFYTTTFKQEWMRKENTWKEDAMTEPQPLTKAHNEQAHSNFFKRTFQENIQSFFSQWKLFDLC